MKPQTYKNYSLISISSVICLKQSEVGSASTCFMENHLQLQMLQIKIDIQISNLHFECGKKENEYHSLLNVTFSLDKTSLKQGYKSKGTKMRYDIRMKQFCSPVFTPTKSK